MTNLFQNLKFAIRLYRRFFGYTIVTLVTLAVGVGINTAVFTAAYSLLFRPLPGTSDPTGLVQLYRTRTKNDVTHYSNLISYPNFLDYRQKNTIFSQMAVWRDTSVALASEHSKPAILQLSGVSVDFFAALGIQPSQGRFFLSGEDQLHGPNAVAVLSYGVWQDYFGSDPNLLGAKINLDGHPFVIVGVAPRDFKGLDTGKTVDLWVPITALDDLESNIKGWFAHRDFSFLFALGRIKSGIDLKTAQAGADLLAHQMQVAYPKENKEIGIHLFPNIGLERNTRNSIERLALTLMGIALLVLLVACINLANLTSAHTLKRQTEIAVRLALGASKRVLVIQMLTESLFISTLGGFAGLLVAFLATRSFAKLALMRQNFPSLDFSIDYHVVIFAFACALLSGLAFALFPALRISRLELNQITKETAVYLGHSRHRISDLLIVLQVAVVLFVLVAAGLLVRTFRNYLAVNRGFDAGNVLLIPFDLTLQNYPEAKGRLFVDEVLKSITALPGVNSAAAVSVTPISGDYTESRGQIPPDEPRYVDLDLVTPQYFKSLNIPIQRGRNFKEPEDPEGTPVAMVNQAALTSFPLGNNPIGKLLYLPDKPTGRSQVEIVGVVADTKQRSLDESPRPVIYLPWSQNYTGQLNLVIRSNIPTVQQLATIQNAINTLDKDFPLGRATTLEQQIRDSLGEQSTTAALVGSLALVALLLSTIGLYGLLFYLISQQRREIGIRMALGAQQADILRFVLWYGLRLVLIGIFLGAIAAAIGTRLLQNFLYGVKPTDPITFGSVSLVLISVAVLAAYLPARRAIKIDPNISLRQH